MSLWLLLDRVLDSLVTVVEIYKGLIRTCAASLGSHCLHLCRLLRTHKVPLSQQTSQSRNAILDLIKHMRQKEILTVNWINRLLSLIDMRSTMALRCLLYDLMNLR